MTRFGYVMTTYCVVLLSVLLSFIPIAPKLIWNNSASAPIGLYAIAPTKRLDIADLVAIDAPPSLANFLAERGYLPHGVPLMKRIAALPGQRVCRQDREITIDGIAMGEALDCDSSGRGPAELARLPRPRGERNLCHELGCPRQPRWPLLRTDPHQLHRRRALPLWTDEGGDGRYQWRAPTR